MNLIIHLKRFSFTRSRSIKDNSKVTFNKNIKLLIVGCNTASAVALNAIKNLSNIPVIDVINPCVQAAILETKKKSIGIIGTETTIASKA